jgi:hypothetical protein
VSWYYTTIPDARPFLAYPFTMSSVYGPSNFPFTHLEWSITQLEAQNPLSIINSTRKRFCSVSRHGSTTKRSPIIPVNRSAHSECLMVQVLKMIFLNKGERGDVDNRSKRGIAVFFGVRIYFEHCVIGTTPLQVKSTKRRSKATYAPSECVTRRSVYVTR